MHKFTKSHLLRILFCSFASIIIIWMTSIMTRLTIYTIYDWLLFSINEGITEFGNDVNTMIVVSTFYHYIIAFFMCGCLWKWFGLPKRILPERRVIE
jgi:hypothetical protein